MNNTTAKEILFIDANVTDKSTLIAGVAPNVKVVELNNKSNVLDQMVAALKGQKNLDAIHIISHGSEGELDFSSGSINNSNLSTYSKQLKKIGQSLSKDGDILLYGCDVAKGDDGQAFINSIAKLTKADVAASDDATGASWLGGDWVLEKSTGELEIQHLTVSPYTALLSAGTLSATGSESGLDYSGVQSITQTVGGQTFSVSGDGTYATGLGFTDNGIYYYAEGSDSNTSDGISPVAVTVTAPNNYTFDMGSLWAYSDQVTSLSLELTYSDNSTATLSIGNTIANSGKTFTLSGGTSVNDVKSVKITAPAYAVFNTFDLSDIKTSSNTAPTLNNLSSDTLTYTVGSGAVVIDQSTAATITDSDSANFDTGVLAVTGIGTGDLIQIRNQGTGAGQIGVSGANITYAGTTIGTYTGGQASNLTVTFNANATPTAVSALLQNLTYRNDFIEAATSHALSITVSDGDGGTSSAASVTINAAPASSANASLLIKVGAVSQGTMGSLGGYNAATDLGTKNVIDVNPIGFDGMTSTFPYFQDGFFMFEGKLYGMFANPAHSLGYQFGRFDGTQIEYFGTQTFEGLNNFAFGNGKIYLNATLTSNGGSRVFEFNVSNSALTTVSAATPGYDAGIQYYNGKLYYFDNTNYSLSSWDGSTVTNIWSAHANSAVFSSNMVVLNGELYFGAEQPAVEPAGVQKFYKEVYKYNATTNTVTQVTNRSGSSAVWTETETPKYLTVFNNKVFFSGSNSSNTSLQDINDRWLVSVDSNGTLVTEYNTGSGTSSTDGSVSGIWNIGGNLYFAASEGAVSYFNLYKYNSAGNATKLTSFSSGTISVVDVAAYGNDVYLTVNDAAATNTGLYKVTGSTVTKETSFPTLATSGEAPEEFDAGMVVFSGQIVPVVSNTLDLVGIMAGGSTPVATALTVTDIDSATITGATVTFTSGKSTGDSLSFTAAYGITGNYDSNTGVLTLSGTTTASNYESVLQSVTFTAGSSAGQREFRFDVTDSDGNQTWSSSPAGKSYIAVTGSAGSVAMTSFDTNPTSGGTVGTINITNTSLTNLQVIANADTTNGTYGLSYDAASHAITLNTDNTSPTQFTIKSANGAEFDFQGLRFYDNWFGTIVDLTFTGFKDAVQTTQTTLNVNAYGPTTTLVLPTTFDDVDEVVVTLGTNAITYSGGAAIGGRIDDILVLPAAPANVAPIITDLDGDSRTFVLGGDATLWGNTTYPWLDVADDTFIAAQVTDADSTNFNGGNLAITYNASVINEALKNGDFFLDTSWGVTSSGDAGTIEAGETLYYDDSSGAVAFGIVGDTTHDGQNGNPLIVTFNGNAIPSDGENVSLFLQAISYTAPSIAGDRVFDVTVSDGTGTSAVSTVTMTGVDETPPTFDVAPATANVLKSSLDLSASLDEAGTIYYVVVPNNAAAPSVAQVLAGQNSTSVAALKSGSSVVTTTPFTSSFSSITGLTAATDYDIYVVAKDAASTPNEMTSVTKVDVTTAANAAPTAISPTSGTISTFDSANATAATLAVTDTDDTTWTFAIQSVTLSGNVQANDNSLFNLASSGFVASNTLRATNPSTLPTGSYTTVVRATDSDGGSHDETLTVTVSNDLVVTVTAIDSNAPSGTYASDVADGGGLDLREALSYANNASGAITVRFADTLSGTITLGANYAVRDGVTLAMDSDTNASSLTITSQSMTLGGTFDVSVGSGDTLTLNSTLADNGINNSALTKTGTGTLVLGGTNSTTSTGLNTVAVNAGNLSIATDSNLGTDAVTLNGGTLEATSSTTIDNAITMESNHGTVSNGNALTLSGIISGAGDLTKSGAGALTLSGTNTYAGATIVSAGTISVAADSNLGTGTLTLNGGGMLTVTGSSINIDNTISLGANHGTVSNANALTLSGIISGMGDLTKSGSGALTFSGTNTYTGATNITAGSLSVAADSNIGTGTLTLNGGTLTVTGSTITVDNDITLGNSHGTVSNANALTLSGIISGTGNLTKSGAGALTLSGSNTYAGTSSFAGGTVNISSDSNLGGGAVTLGTNGVLSITQTATIDNAIILNAAPAQITISSGATATLTGVISETGGSRGLNKGGAGTLVIDNNATYTGATALNGGIFELAATTTLATSGIMLNNSSPTLKITGSGTFATPIIVRGTGTNSISVDDVVTLSNLVSLSSDATANRILTKIGTGTLTLGNSGNTAAGTVISGANTYTLGLTVSGGTVSMAGDANLMAGTITLNGGDLTITGATTIDNAIALNSASTVNNASAVTLSGVISGSGALTKSGAGTMTLSGTNTYAGATTVSAGTLSIAADSHLGTGTLTLNGSTLAVTGSGITIDNAIALGSSNSTVSNAGELTLSGVISGASDIDLTKNGAGTLTLSGANTYAGTTTVSAGTLSIATDSHLGTGTLTLDGGTLAVTGTGITVDNAIALGSSDGTLSNANAVILSGVISGVSGADLNKSGTGTLTLSGTNTFSGETTVSAGTLSIAADNNLGAGTLTLAAGTTLAITEATTVNNAIALSGNATIDTSAAATVSSVISGSFDLTKIGSNTLTLSGIDTYTGTTTVSAGTLSVTGSLANTSSVTVNSNATLDGTGSIFASGSTNTMTVSSGGTLSSGVSGAGTLTVNGNLTLSSGSTLAVDINGAIAGTGYDQVVVNGTVDVSGATLSATLGYTQGQGDSYTLINNDGTDGIIGTFGGLSEGGTQSISGVNFTASYVGGSSSSFG